MPVRQKTLKLKGKNAFSPFIYYNTDKIKCQFYMGAQKTLTIVFVLNTAFGDCLSDTTGLIRQNRLWQ
jgi:hypothetical protein